ncbi:transposase [Alkalicoccobacillus plakortidis]|uniref:Transposase n=1 Tax=Alkalicoccobacillus plakortidis TaxID=444060 RepID=A0ABT0XFT6_9BACI|nr:transposase [Alkalicoccobacillus plakortidis]MCM2674560.1 transposase [Alkalicoccobacillus plakortidis]
MFLVSFLFSILVPTIMLLIQKKWTIFKSVFDIIALLCLLIFISITASAIYEILADNTVFMTNIHALFLNGFFLVSGGYVVLYAIYKIMYGIVKT